MSITETFNLLVNHNSQRLRENETIAEERKETEMLAACQHKRSSHSCSKQMQKHLLKKSNVATASKWDIMPTQVYRTGVQLLQCYAEDEDDEENDDDDINFTFHLYDGAITITQKTHDQSELGPA